MVMSTIEKRLDMLQFYAICEEDTGLTWKDGALCSATNQVATERDAIIDVYNTAIEAMKAVLNDLSYMSNGVLYCAVCDSSNEQGHIWDCCAGKCQTAIAKMKGLPEEENYD